MTHAPETRRCSTVSVSSAPAFSQLHTHPMRGSCSRRSTRATRRRWARVLNNARALVSNPPFGRDALPIAESLVELVHAGSVEMAALLAPALWEAASGPRRVTLMRAMALRIVCCWRPIWIEGTAGGGKLNYAWHVWTREAPLFSLAIQVTRSEAEARRAP